jgi:hypothetical protein
MHREIMLSSTYQLSTRRTKKNDEKDPENKLLWRANLIERLDAEALRDAILAVSGQLDLTIGGPPVEFEDSNHRRAVYGTVSRTKPDRSMALFDFPDANASSEERVVTLGPMQRLYFMNNPFVMEQAKALAERLQKEAASGPEARIRLAYELLYGRPPSEHELQLGLEYLREGENAWAKYTQVLLASSEFSSVN